VPPPLSVTATPLLLPETVCVNETESPAATVPLFTKVIALVRLSAMPGACPALGVEPLLIVALLVTVPVPFSTMPDPGVPATGAVTPV